MVSEPVKPYFTRFLRVLTFCLGASKIVIFCENGVVNGVVDEGIIEEERIIINYNVEHLSAKSLKIVDDSLYGTFSSIVL